jgi:hypothetical protein
MTRKLTLVIIVALMASRGWGGDREIRLPDLEGVVRSPLSIGQGMASVLLFVTHDCPISNGFAPEYRRLRGRYPTNRVSFTLVYVDPDANSERLRRHRREFGLTNLVAIHDREHRLVQSVEAEMTPEAVVINSAGGVAYRGRVDDRFADYGKRRAEPTRHDLRDALDAVLAGKPVVNPRVEAIGCHIPPLEKTDK